MWLNFNVHLVNIPLTQDCFSGASWPGFFDNSASTKRIASEKKYSCRYLTSSISLIFLRASRISFQLGTQEGSSLAGYLCTT